MLSVERQKRIVSLCSENTFCSLRDLADALGVSISTARRDLDLLQEQGIVRRTHGGAMFLGHRDALPRFLDRQSRLAREKSAIGARAAELVEDGDTIIIDGGSTPYQVAVHLQARPAKNIQVITNSLHVANVLADAKNIQLIATGGMFFPASGIYLGPYAEAMLKGIRAQKVFMGAAGITEEGLYNSNPLVVETERCMLEAAAEVYVVADHTKFGRNALAYLCNFDVITSVVTDTLTGVHERTRDALLRHDLNVICTHKSEEAI